MNYYDTFIQVARDCPAEEGTVPPERSAPTVARIQYELLANEPYCYTQEEILFESYVRRIEPDATKKRRQELWGRFFSKPQACLRASPLPKNYGWGIHFDAQGRAAIFGRESAEYRERSRDGKGTDVVYAMNNRRPKP